MLHLTLRQLKVFEAVARHLSYSKAARELHLTQPAVSMQVRSLEESVGLALTEQMGKKIFLTEAGQEVAHYSQSIAVQLADLETALNLLKGADQGQLNIAIASTANAVATDLLAGFRTRHPGVAIQLGVTNRQEILAQLAANRIDLAIMGQVPDGMELQATRFMDNPLGIIAPPGHPLARKKRIPVAQLADESFLVRETGSGTRGAMERFFAERGVTLHTSMEMNSNEAIRQAVSAGLGLGILSLQTLELELTLKRLVVLDVVDFPIMRHWYLVHRADKRLSPVAQAFKNFVLASPGAGSRKKRG